MEMENPICEIFDRAIEARDRKEFGVAEGILKSIANRVDDKAAFHAVLASVLWSEGKITEAITSFSRATELAPSSEVVSVGLFHCLIKNGRVDDAFNEIRRFLATNESPEYVRLLREMKESFLSD